MAQQVITTKALNPNNEWEEMTHEDFASAGMYGLQCVTKGFTDMRTYLNGEEISNEIFFAEMKKELDAKLD